MKRATEGKGMEGKGKESDEKGEGGMEIRGKFASLQALGKVLYSR